MNVEEKVDGSQFSFGLFSYPVCGECGLPTRVPGIGKDCPHDAADAWVGELRVRSKGAIFPIDAPPKMFARACATVQALAEKLTPGWTYRGEVLDKPKHNTLAYDRTPIGHIIIFDIARGEEDYLSYEEKKLECERLGLEVVPLLYSGSVKDPSTLRQFFDRTSVLGGQKIEGIVIKPTANNLFAQDKKLLIGKFVSEAFKEVHQHAWQENPDREKKGGEILEILTKMYATPARWDKAIQHLRDDGKLEESPRDIGKLIAEIPADIAKDSVDDIKDALWKWAWPQLKRSVIRGFPEYYKQRLLERQFETGEVCEGSD